MIVFPTKISKLVCVMTLSLGLFACGNDKPAESTNSTENTATTTQPKSGKTITVAVTSDYAPFTFLNETGNIIGFDADVINAIGQKKGFNVQFKPTNFDGMFTDIEQGGSDIAMSAIFATEERGSRYSLTNPYYQSSPVYFYRADNTKLGMGELNTLADLNGKGLNLVGTAGTLHVERIKGVTGSNSANTVKSDFEGFSKVLRKDADVALTDASIFSYSVKQHNATGENKLKSVAYMGEQNYVMVLKKDNTELQTLLNEGLNEITQSGELKALQDKWFK